MTVIIVLVVIIASIVSVYCWKRSRKRGLFNPHAARPTSRVSKDYWFGEEEKIVSKTLF